MKKIIGKYGGTQVVTFSKKELLANGWEVGDVVEVSNVYPEEPMKQSIYPLEGRVNIKSIENEKQIDFKELKELVKLDDGESNGSSA